MKNLKDFLNESKEVRPYGSQELTYDEVINMNYSKLLTGLKNDKYYIPDDNRYEWINDCYKKHFIDLLKGMNLDKLKREINIANIVEVINFSGEKLIYKDNNIKMYIIRQGINEDDIYPVIKSKIDWKNDVISVPYEYMREHFNLHHIENEDDVLNSIIDWLKEVQKTENMELLAF